MIALRLTVGSGALELDKRRIRGIMRSVGNEIAAVTRSLIRGSAGGGKIYSKPGGGRYTASAPGQPPVSRTGEMVGSIVVLPFRSGEGVAIRERAFYSLFLAKGAHGGGGNTTSAANMHVAKSGKRRMNPSAINKSRILLPRPSLERALEERAPTIGPRLKEALLSGLRFKRIRA